ncbi:MAG: hypothetical protein OSB45_10905 [Pseudomonadales bacterium]|nr:hypothetical protein [Pseudomonadales bacterium]
MVNPSLLGTLGYTRSTEILASAALLGIADPVASSGNLNLNDRGEPNQINNCKNLIH